MLTDRARQPSLRSSACSRSAVDACCRRPSEPRSPETCGSVAKSVCRDVASSSALIYLSLILFDTSGLTPPWRARREAAPRSSRLGARPGLRPDGPYGPGPVYVRPLGVLLARLRLARRVKWAPPPWRAPREATPRSSRLGNLFYFRYKHSVRRGTTLGSSN